MPYLVSACTFCILQSRYCTYALLGCFRLTPKRSLQAYTTLKRHGVATKIFRHAPYPFNHALAFLISATQIYKMQGSPQYSFRHEGRQPVGRSGLLGGNMGRLLQSESLISTGLNVDL